MGIKIIIFKDSYKYLKLMTLKYDDVTKKSSNATGIKVMHTSTHIYVYTHTQIHTHAQSYTHTHTPTHPAYTIL